MVFGALCAAFLLVLIGVVQSSHIDWSTLWVMPFVFLIYAFFAILLGGVIFPVALAGGWPVWRILQGYRIRLTATVLVWTICAAIAAAGLIAQTALPWETWAVLPIVLGGCLSLLAAPRINRQILAYSQQDP